MKKINSIALIIILILAPHILLAQKTIELKECGLNAALEMSKKEHKLVFYMCYASWCPHCNYMKTNVFTDSSVAAFYNKNYICVGQDMEKGEGIALKNSLEISSYPTYIFFDSTGVQLYRYAGELKTAEFIEEGRNALYPHHHLPNLKKEFEKDYSNAKTCYDYIRALKRGGLSYMSAVKQYFNTQREEDLLNLVNWSIIANGTTEINSREFQYLLKHQEEFAAITSVERVERKIYSVVNSNLSALLVLRDTVNYPVVHKQIEDIKLKRIDSILFAYDMVFYESINKWDAYQQATFDKVEKYIWNNYFQLNKIAEIYLKHITDPTALNKAILWTNRSLDIYKQYNTYLLAARLYLKTKQKKEAADMALKARNMNAENGFDHREANQLLVEIQNK